MKGSYPRSVRHNRGRFSGGSDGRPVGHWGIGNEQNSIFPKPESLSPNPRTPKAPKP